MIDSPAEVHIVMPTKVGIHDFADASRKVVDGGPPPAMPCSGRRWVIPFAGWYQGASSRTTGWLGTSRTPGALVEFCNDIEVSRVAGMPSNSTVNEPVR